MTGKNLRNSLRLILWLVTVLLGVTPALAADDSPIVVLLSASEMAYNRPVITFTEEINRPVRRYNLRGNITADPQLKDKILASNPQLIFALGAKAAYTAKLWTRHHQEIPVLFAMVFNWHHYHLLDQKNMAGIAAEMAPGTQFINMTILSPQVKRVGIVFGEQSTSTVNEASQAAKLLGLELVRKPISQAQNFRRAFKQLTPQVDAYWVVNDPLVYTLDNMDWLKERCLKERLICIGQSANIAQAGLLLAVTPDPTGLGSQAASLAHNILAGHQTPAQIGVMPPLTTQIILNRQTSQRIGLSFSNQALDLATKVID